MDGEKAHVVRQKIALYRRYLNEGASDVMARIYLVEIVNLEAGLKAIERDGDRR